MLSVEDELGSHRLSFRFDEAADEYVLTSDREDGPFRVASYIVEQILVSAEELEPGADETVDEEDAPSEAETAEPQSSTSD